MPRNDFEIVVEPGKVTVVYDERIKSPYTRFWVAAGYLAFGVCLICLFLFSPGKHGTPGPWHTLRSTSPGGFDFVVALCLLLALIGFIGWRLIRYVRVVYPGFQKLGCDTNMLTVTQLRWWDWKNKSTTTEYYLLADITQLRFGAIFRGRGSIAGLVFSAAGRTYGLFPKLTTNRAGKILAGLESLGVETRRHRKKRKVGIQPPA